MHDRVRHRVHVAVELRRIGGVAGGRIPAEGAPGGRVVGAGAQLIQVGGRIVPLAIVAMGARGRPLMAQQITEGVVAGAVGDGSAAIRQRANATLAIRQGVAGGARLSLGQDLAVGDGVARLHGATGGGLRDDVAVGALLIPDIVRGHAADALAHSSASRIVAIAAARAAWQRDAGQVVGGVESSAHVATVCIYLCQTRKLLRTSSINSRIRSEANEQETKTGDEVRRMTTPTWPNRSVEEYIALLQDGDWRMRRQAAAALWLLGDQRAVEPLIATLQHDTSAEARENAARALAWLGDRRAIAPLTEATAHDADAKVRATATLALTKLEASAQTVGSGNASPDPFDALISAALDPATRYDAVRALGQRRDPRAVATLIGLLKEPFDPNLPAVSVALGQIGASSLPALLSILTDMSLDFRSRMTAADAIGFVGSTQARALLQQALATEPHPAVRMTIERAIKSLR